MFKKIFHIFSSEIFIIILLSLLILGLSFSCLFYFISLTPPNTVFPLIHNYAPDFNLYLQFIRQSYEGNWLFIDRFTPEDFPARFVYLGYLLIGKLSYIFHLDLSVSYHIFRLVCAVLYIWLIYILVKKIYPQSKKHRILSMFFILFGTGFVSVAYNANNFIITRPFSYWTEIEPLERLSYIPHHLLSKVLVIASLLALNAALMKKNFLILIFAAITGFFCGLSSPFVYVNYLITVILTLVLYCLINLKQLKKHLLSIWFLIIFAAFSGLSLIYLRWLETATFPWNIYISWEKTVFNINFLEYLQFCGITFFLSFFAVKHFLTKNTFLTTFLVCWIFCPLFSIFVFSPFIPIQKIRFLSGATFIPCGIMASWGFFYLFRKKFIQAIVLLLSIIIFSIYIYSNFQDQRKAFNPNSYNNYFPVQIVNSLKFLDKNTKTDAVVLAQGYLGNIIPAYSHNKVVLGHMTNTYEIVNKGTEVNKFFEQKDLEFAKIILNKYKVSYIYYSLDTPPPDYDYLNKLGYKKVFEEDRTIIFSRP